MISDCNDVDSKIAFHLELMSCSLGGAYDRQIQQQGRVFEHILAQRGGNLNDPIFRSSNARVFPGGGC